MPEPRSSAARFNDQVLRKLQKALAADPEADLLDRIPVGYSNRLAEKKEQKIGKYSGAVSLLD